VPQQFDMTIGDTVMDAKGETDRELMERTRQAKQKRVDIREIVVKSHGTVWRRINRPIICGQYGETGYTTTRRHRTHGSFTIRRSTTTRTTWFRGDYKFQ
jgi:hypothetical protein